MRSGGSPTTLGVLLYAIGATAQPTGLFSDASACGKLSKTCDALASARAPSTTTAARARWASCRTAPSCVEINGDLTYLDESPP